MVVLDGFLDRLVGHLAFDAKAEQAMLADVVGRLLAPDGALDGRH